MSQTREVLDKGYVELQDTMGNDLAIVNAARVSYLGASKGPEKDRKLLNYLWQNKHLTPFEMCEYKFRVKCPLFVARQWMRHRTFNYNELSRRYTAAMMEFYTPKRLRGQSVDNKQASTEEFVEKIPVGDRGELAVDIRTALHSRAKKALELYKSLLSYGVAKEQARMVLPQSMYTIFIAKIDLRNLLHFIKLRSHYHAQWEIQQYSNTLFEFVKEYNPWTAEIFLEGLDLEEYPGFSND